MICVETFLFTTCFPDDEAEKRRRVSMAPGHAVAAAPKLTHVEIAELLKSVVKMSTSNVSCFVCGGCL